MKQASRPLLSTLTNQVIGPSANTLFLWLLLLHWQPPWPPLLLNLKLLLRSAFSPSSIWFRPRDISSRPPPWRRLCWLPSPDLQWELIVRSLSSSILGIATWQHLPHFIVLISFKNQAFRILQIIPKQKEHFLNPKPALKLLSKCLLNEFMSDWITWLVHMTTLSGASW